MKILSADPGNLKCELILHEEHVNSLGTLHGSMITSLVDVVSGIAVITHHMCKDPLSVELNTSFMRSAALGEKITICADVIGVDDNLVYASIHITNEMNKLIARGGHTMTCSNKTFKINAI
ncbi:acyl-coenzyme A thioesterase 13-like [Saccoglossus kowalevskii]